MTAAPHPCPATFEISPVAMLDPRLQRLLALSRAEELRGAAAARPRPPIPEPASSIDLAITLRYGFPDDAEAIARLSALDSSEVPGLPILLAEVAGELRAAISLADGRVVAHPFYSTVMLVDLLHTRAEQLQRVDPQEDGARSRWWGRLRLPAWR
jgi:hypothetical protein